jgi:hypothetical protein
MRPVLVPTKRVPSTSAVVVAAHGPLRMAELDRVVQYVAGDDAKVADPHTEMPGCVSRRHLEVDVACECPVGVHRIGKPGVDDGLHGIGKRGYVQRIA